MFAVMFGRPVSKPARASTLASPLRSGANQSIGSAADAAAKPGRLPSLRWMTRLFVGHLHLRRKGRDFEIQLVERAPSEASSAAPAQTAATTGTRSTLNGESGHRNIPANDVQLMHHDLRAALNMHPAARQVLGHLAFLEKALRHEGGKVFHSLPTAALRKAQQQLEPLCVDSPAYGLSLLCSHLSVTLLDREPPDIRHEPGPSTMPALSDFTDPARLQVEEVSVSVFMEADQQLAQLAVRNKHTTTA